MQLFILVAQGYAVVFQVEFFVRKCKCALNLPILTSLHIHPFNSLLAQLPGFQLKRVVFGG